MEQLQLLLLVIGWIWWAVRFQLRSWLVVIDYLLLVLLQLLLLLVLLLLLPAGHHVHDCVIHHTNNRLGLVQVGANTSASREGGLAQDGCSCCRGRSGLASHRTRRPGLCGQAAAAPLQVIGAHAFAYHAAVKALLVATILASIPAPLVNYTIHGARANVLRVLLDRALEEPLAALTGPHPVVLAGGIVAANGTNMIFLVAIGIIVVVVIALLNSIDARCLVMLSSRTCVILVIARSICNHRAAVVCLTTASHT